MTTESGAKTLDWGEHSDAHTFTGAEVWYLEPERTPIRSLDLFVQLARIPRYGGCVDWSVLRHSVLVASLASVHQEGLRRISLCAAHDLHEAYVLDIPAGLKRHLPDYRAIEARWEAHVHRALGYTWPLPEDDAAAVKVYDRLALRVELWHRAGPHARRLLVEQPHPTDGAVILPVASMDDLGLRTALIRLCPLLNDLPGQ